MSCITNAVFDNRGGYYPSRSPHDLSLADYARVRLTRTVSFALAQRYMLVVSEEHAIHRWRVDVVGYAYTIATTPNGAEIVTYHWHPEDVQLVKSPHLHLGPGAQIGREELHKAHLPTGHVTVADVIRLLITDFGVRPRRDDWATILGHD